jgi:hypothetical protein
MRLLSTLLLVAAVAGCPPVAAKTQVVIPLQLDYPLLYELLRSQLFTGPGTSLEVLNDPSGCSEAVMSAPTIAPEQGRLQLTAALAANLGIGAPGSCTRLLTWSGRIRVSGAPEIRQDGTALGFQPDEVLLLDTAGQRVTNDSLQAVARAGVRNALERFVVDLRPQLASVGDFLPSVLPRHSREQIEALVATLRVQEIHVREESVDAQISLRVDALPPEVGPEGPLSDEELARWEERWQLMDALLVLAVKHYAASTQLQELRDALLDALIESRYRLRDALTETPTNATDTVRDWFLQSWQSLTPIFRRIALEQPRQEHLLLLSVITAGDALDALDRVGPAVGVEISTDGLRRLARMINSDAAPGVLEYSNDLDPQLRRLFEASLGDAGAAAQLAARCLPVPQGHGGRFGATEQLGAPAPGPPGVPADGRRTAERLGGKDQRGARSRPAVSRAVPAPGAHHRLAGKLLAALRGQRRAQAGAPALRERRRRPHADQRTRVAGVL